MTTPKTLYVQGYILFSLISSIVVLTISTSTMYTNPFAAYPLIILALMVLASSASSIPRFRVLAPSDPYKYGVAVIQHAWWPTSCGFAGLVMFHADYFTRALGPTSMVLLAISAVWFAWGVYVMISIHRKTGAPLMP